MSSLDSNPKRPTGNAGDGRNATGAYRNLHFEPNLDFQLPVIEEVCDLFRGQEVCRTEFTVMVDPATPPARLAFAENLQKEIGEDTGIRFGVMERHQFAYAQELFENEELTGYLRCELNHLVRKLKTS